MSLLETVTIETADGKVRELRFSIGSRIRIEKRFGASDIRTVLNDNGDAALPGLIHSCMFSVKGDPPDISEDELAELLPGDKMHEHMAAFMSVVTQGRTKKKDIEEKLLSVMMANLTGIDMLPNVSGSSISPKKRSSGASGKRRSKRSGSAEQTTSESKTIDLESSQPPSTTSSEEQSTKSGLGETSLVTEMSQSNP